MKTRTLLIYFIISSIAFAFAIIPKSETNYFNHLKSQIDLSNQIMSKMNQAILAAIQTQVEAYPEYELFLENAKAIDSISNHLIQTKSSDISIIKHQFYDLIDLNEYDKKHIEDITASFLDYHFPNNSTSELLQNTLNETALRVNSMTCLNFLASRSPGSHTGGCWFDYSEPIMVNNQTLLEYGKPHTFQFALGKPYDSNQQKTTRISVNGATLKLRDAKGRFKAKTTKSSWNEMKVVINATFKNRQIRKEKTASLSKVRRPNILRIDFT